MNQEDFKRDFSKLCDRTMDPRACVGRVVDSWGYDLSTRSLGPAYLDPDSGAFVTDLDLAAFVAGSLVPRRAMITLPNQYKGRRAATKKEGEVLVDNAGRHGVIEGVTSNKDVFSFSMRVFDQNVVTEDEVGQYRNFMLQDLDGSWHDGLDLIRIEPKTDEEKLLFAHTNQISFKYFIHPNRYNSFYGRPYLLAKVAIMRCQDQTKFLDSEIRRLRKALNVEPKKWAKSEKVGSEKSEYHWAFNAAVDGVTFKGDYKAFPTTEEGLEEATSMKKRLKSFMGQLSFHTRATEYAFWSEAVKPVASDPLDYLKHGNGSVKKPAWCRDEWCTGFKEKPTSRTYWAAIPRDEDLTLRWRCWKKKESVAA